MNLQKLQKYIIPAFVTLSLLFAVYLIWAIFFKGTLSVKITPAPAKLYVDYVEYPNVATGNFKLQAGKHKIVIKKDYYQTFETTVQIKPWQTTILEKSLEPTQDAKDVFELSNKVATLWINFTKDKNSSTLLQKIQPLISSENYSSLADLIKSTTIRTKYMIIDLPEVTGPIKNMIIGSLTPNSAKTKLYVTKKQGDDLSIDNFDFEFAKINGKWTVSNYLYNY